MNRSVVLYLSFRHARNPTRLETARATGPGHFKLKLYVLVSVKGQRKYRSLPKKYKCQKKLDFTDIGKLSDAANGYLTVAVPS